MMHANRKASAAPGFLDSIIIILVAAALVLFLLWATSRTQHIVVCEQLPYWIIRDSYHAVWTAAASGATGIGLAIVRVFARRREDPRPNYLLWIMLVTLLLLVLIFLLPVTPSLKMYERIYGQSLGTRIELKQWLPFPDRHIWLNKYSGNQGWLRESRNQLNGVLNPTSIG